jgi:hypothetical protein
MKNTYHEKKQEVNLSARLTMINIMNDTIYDILISNLSDQQSWHDHCFYDENDLNQNQDNDWKRGWLRKECGDFMIGELYNIANSLNQNRKGERL